MFALPASLHRGPLLGLFAALAQDPAPAPAQAPGNLPDGRLFVEYVLDTPSPWVGETVVVRLRFGVEETFLEEHLVPLFRRALDLPLRLELASPEPPSCLEPLKRAGSDGPAGPSASTASLVVDGDRALARRLSDERRDGADFRVHELVREFRVLSPGEVRFPPPVLRFAWTEAFDEDLFRGPVPRDRRDGRLVGAPAALLLRPLPEDGRPLSFTGAIGAIQADARLEPTDLAPGDRARLWLAIDGPGAGTFEPPSLDDLSGWHVLGRHEERDGSARVFVYELTPAHGRTATLPPIELSYFDPAPPAGYRTLHTAAVPVRVRAGGPPPTDRAQEPTRNGGRRPWPLLALAAAAAAALAWGYLRRRARRSTETADVRESGEGVTRAMIARLEEDGLDHAAWLTELLAARLGLAPHDVHGPHLARRLEEAHLPADLARRTARAVQRLHAARYGPGAAGGDLPGSCELRELALLIEAACTGSSPAGGERSAPA